MQQRRYSIRVNGLPPGTTFTLDALVAHVNVLAAALAAAGCSIIMITLPPIGEDLGSDVNARVGFACTVLRPDMPTGITKCASGCKVANLWHVAPEKSRWLAFLTLPLTGEQLGGAMHARVGAVVRLALIANECCVGKRVIQSCDLSCA